MSLLKDIWSAVSGVGKGMEKTYDEQFQPIFTDLYPFELPKLPPVSVQSLALIQNEDGSDRCVSCLACEKVCPSQVITIERKRNPAGKGFVLERFDIDLVNCMYCAACVESCPAQAIVTIQDFEMSTPNLQSLKADKEFLDLQGLRAAQWYSPKVGVEYRVETPENPTHGKIVKAPVEDQPGGMQEMEKARLAALEPAKPVVEKTAAPKSEAAPVESVGALLAAPASAPTKPESAPAPVAPSVETSSTANPKIKRFVPKDAAVPAVEIPATPVVETPKLEASATPDPVGAHGNAPASAPTTSESVPTKLETPAPLEAAKPVESTPASLETPAATEEPKNPKIKRWIPKEKGE
jgi:NADH-quinone oxidoreductase subunit I